MAFSRRQRGVKELPFCRHSTAHAAAVKRTNAALVSVVLDMVRGYCPSNGRASAATAHDHAGRRRLQAEVRRRAPMMNEQDPTLQANLATLT